MRRGLLWLLALLLALAQPAPASAYLKFGFRIDDRTVDVKWPTGPVRYFVNDRDVPGVTAPEFRAAVGRAAATWQAVPETSLSFEYQGMTAATPNQLDGRNTFGFLDRPDLDRVLGSTSLLLDAATGQIVEADIFFNTAFPWSVSTGGEAGRVDVESVVLHELVHLVGLGHRIDRAKRLVHQDHGRVGRQRPSETDTLSLPAGQLVRPAIAKRRRRQVHQRQQLVDTGGDPFLAPAEQPWHRGDVAGNRAMGEQADVLHHVTRLPPQLLGLPLAHGATAHQHFTTAGRQHAVDQAQQRRLAAAASPHQRHDLTRADRQRQPSQDGRRTALE